MCIVLNGSKIGGELPCRTATGGIYFIDLGDLIAIVTGGRNWPLFQGIFADKQGFTVDIQRLNAWRRPVMHGRRIDPVQFVELLFVVNRLMASIRDSTHWQNHWNDEE
ncbi:hypothetical protein [Novosphingobium terrae]|uniref:hypothetical protein n=1 Tax=Novosphingobium terrae TaxID=2726189 RepID=UPI00197CC3A5|nr:hypothetical protein [Novosphingobium terrae]